MRDNRIDLVEFFARGVPVPQGSVKGFAHGGRVYITADNRSLKSWRDLVAAVAQQHAPPVPWTGAVSMTLTFYLPRPQSEPVRKVTFPTRRPDLDKCVRAVFDALTGIVFVDDSQVVDLAAKKEWADDPHRNVNDRKPPGVAVLVHKEPVE
jgi:crossover junction endodeoxyribonuclease RusA